MRDSRMSESEPGQLTAGWNPFERFKSNLHDEALPPHPVSAGQSWGEYMDALEDRQLIRRRRRRSVALRTVLVAMVVIIGYAVQH